MNPEIKLAREISSKLEPSRRWQAMTPTNDPHPDAKIYENDVYTATLRRHSDGWPFGGGKWAMIGIYCEDGQARHDWRDFQNIKKRSSRNGLGSNRTLPSRIAQT